jgi:hypothetical protein
MAILLRMVVNIVIDFIVGLVPILGDFLDNLWKANLRNLELLEVRPFPSCPLPFPPLSLSLSLAPYPN